MLPEIALTSQFIDRFDAPLRRAAGRVALGVRARRARPRLAGGVAAARRSVVVGARSALFLPFPDLGLIVVDEEHDAGLKQEDRVHYQARDMAVVRGNLGGFPVVLASATPSIESHVNAGAAATPRPPAGALRRARAAGCRRHRPAPAPAGARQWLSPVLVEAVAETLGGGEQALLFLNRRGYAPLTLCRTCGHRIDCPQCTAWLVEHRFRHRLNCHHCGFSLPMPEKCPKCGEPDTLVACGPGVERIAEEVAERFPEARVALLSSDLVPSSTEMRADHQDDRGAARPTSSSARRWWPRATTFPSLPWSAWSTAIWGWRRPTRARPSAPSSSCTR